MTERPEAGGLGQPSASWAVAVGVGFAQDLNGCGSKPMGSHFWVGAPPILEPILVGIGMFTGGTGFDPRPNVGSRWSGT